MPGPIDGAKPIGFIPVTDRERSRLFYQGTLGLELVADEPFALVFTQGGHELRLTIVESLTPQPVTVFGWQVDDIERSVRRLVASGVSFERYAPLDQDAAGTWRSPSGARIAWFKDPDGNLLSLTQA